MSCSQLEQNTEMAVKVEKANAILRFKRLRNFKFLFRFIEICIVLFIISTFSTDFLTFYSRICGNFLNFFFCRLSFEILSPTTIFVIGNMIILILFSNYGNFSAQESESCNNNEVVYSKHLEFFEKNENMIIEQGKHGKYEEKNISLDLCIPEVSKMQRSKSEVFKGYHDVSSCRTVTKSYRKSVSYNNRVDAEMTGDEFRQMVEGFIARQQRSLREQEDKDELPAYATFET